jgi:hypothetical protein
VDKNRLYGANFPMEDWESSLEDRESSGGKSGIFRLYADMTGEASNGHFGLITDFILLCNQEQAFFACNGNRLVRTKGLFGLEVF